MIISGTIKKKPNRIDNIQKLIDSAGETQFKNIYKNLQTELKDKIITKLLSKLNILNKRVEEYKQEIISLKNDLVYLLKRVILTKNENKLNRNYKNKLNYNKLIKNSTTNNLNNNRAFSPLNNTMSQLKSFSNFYNQTEINNNNTTINNNFESPNLHPINNIQNELDIKINNYINSIYKHNFLKNETNINYYYFLNKKENLFEEIFQKKNGSKYTELYLGTEPNINKKNVLKNNRSQRNISASLLKRPIESSDKIRKRISTSMANIKNENAYISNNKFGEIRDNNEGYYEDEKEDDKEEDNNNEKLDIINTNNNKEKNYLKVKKKRRELNIETNHLNNYKNFKNKTYHHGFYSNTNGNKTCTNNCAKKKNIKNNKFIPLNRSPFIINKF